jgi:hypothetical protein
MTSGRRGSFMRRPVPPLPTLHLELWVALRKDRTRLSRILRRTYKVARRITQGGGGNGPWVFLIDQDPMNAKTTRLRTILGLRTEEDLWLELVFYPNRVSMRNIIRRIWIDPQFGGYAATLDSLISRRKAGYEATVAYAALKVL